MFDRNDVEILLLQRGIPAGEVELVGMERGGILIRESVHVGSKQLRRLPAEVVLGIVAVRHVNVVAANPTRPVTEEVERMPVVGEIRSRVQAGSIDDRAEVDRRFPRAVFAGAPGNPQVLAAHAAGAVGRQIQTQSVLRQEGMILGEGGIDRRSKVHRRGPLRPRRRHESGPSQADDGLLRLSVASNEKNECYEGGNGLAHRTSRKRTVTRGCDVKRSRGTWLLPSKRKTFQIES